MLSGTKMRLGKHKGLRSKSGKHNGAQIKIFNINMGEPQTKHYLAHVVILLQRA